MPHAWRLGADMVWIGLWTIDSAAAVETKRGHSANPQLGTPLSPPEGRDFTNLFCKKPSASHAMCGGLVRGFSSR
jgi:hypothetical protein